MVVHYAINSQNRQEAQLSQRNRATLNVSGNLVNCCAVQNSYLKRLAIGLGEGQLKSSKMARFDRPCNDFLLVVCSNNLQWRKSRKICYVQSLGQGSRVK